MPERRLALKSIALAPLASLTGLQSAMSRAQGSSGAAGGSEISAADAQRDLRILQRAFDALHPGLHRYTTAEAIDAAFVAAKAAVAQGCSRAEMFLLASGLAAGLQCGHTWASPYNQRQDLVEALFQRADKLPFTQRWVEDRVLITGSAAAGLVTGSELLAIDRQRTSGHRRAADDGHP